MMWTEVRGALVKFGILWMWLLLGVAPCAAGAEVTVVMSSTLRPYEEAFEGFQAALGPSGTAVKRIVTPSGVPTGTRVVAAFGGKAAVQPYPAGVPIVYCMAPGTRVGSSSDRHVVEVGMLPTPKVLLTHLKRIQPDMRKLGILVISEGVTRYVDELANVTAGLDVTLIVQRLGAVGELPDGLRTLQARGIDAIWVPADPLLITARNFLLLTAFASENDIPLYAPTSGLVEKGATASVSVGFRDVGARAAAAVQALLEGRDVGSVVHPDIVEISLNLPAARSAGLSLSSDILLRATRVIE